MHNFWIDVNVIESPISGKFWNMLHSILYFWPCFFVLFCFVFFLFWFCSVFFLVRFVYIFICFFLCVVVSVFFLSIKSNISLKMLLSRLKSNFDIYHGNVQTTQRISKERWHVHESPSLTTDDITDITQIWLKSH